MANPFTEDTWDWPYILYAGIVFLNYPEEQVWNLTPRKFKALLDVHYEVLSVMNGGKTTRTSSQMTHIDQIPGW